MGGWRAAVVTAGRIVLGDSVTGYISSQAVEPDRVSKHSV